MPDKNVYEPLPAFDYNQFYEENKGDDRDEEKKEAKTLRVHDIALQNIAKGDTTILDRTMLEILLSIKVDGSIHLP